MSITSASLEREVSDGRHSGDKTHIKDLNNLVKVQFPAGDLFLIVLCTETLRNQISFSLLVDIPFDLPRSSGVEWKVPLTAY